MGYWILFQISSLITHHPSFNNAQDHITHSFQQAFKQKIYSLPYNQSFAEPRLKRTNGSL
jgi:hypothetical protein